MASASARVRPISTWPPQVRSTPAATVAASAAKVTGSGPHAFHPSATPAASRAMVERPPTQVGTSASRSAPQQERNAASRSAAGGYASP